MFVKWMLKLEILSQNKAQTIIIHKKPKKKRKIMY